MFGFLWVTRFLRSTAQRNLYAALGFVYSSSNFVSRFTSYLRGLRFSFCVFRFTAIFPQTQHTKKRETLIIYEVHLRSFVGLP